ncbi:NAD-dependent epimerase/dehydratase family protein [candidate division KSB1 bacterium]|nr:NAD-dependent epimerase/dehydratase family protein [candidate division KSB1 bacterium]
MSFKEKKILVTGGAGFVGSNLVDRLVEEGAEVIVLDDLFTGRKENITNFNSIEFIQGSVSDIELIDKLIKRVDLVFNLAVRNIIVSTKSPLLDFQVNTGGIVNILLAAKKHGIERVIYTSSASIYGNPRYLPINEDDSLSTLNPYAASKLSSENYCHAFFESFQVPMAIVRYSNVYGIKQSPLNPYCGVVSKFFESIMNGQAPQIHGDGEQTRDFTYVSDAVEATLLAALKPKAEGEVFNVGTGKETSVNELVEKIIQIVGVKTKPIYIDRRDIDNIRRRVLNIERSRKVLRWVPIKTLRTGLEETYQWLKSI